MDKKILTYKEALNLAKANLKKAKHDWRKYMVDVAKSMVE